MEGQGKAADAGAATAENAQQKPLSPKKKVSVQFGQMPPASEGPIKRGMSRKKTPMPANARQECEEHREQLEKWGETPPPESQDMAYLKEAEAVLEEDSAMDENK
ncbi:hypothetical protein FVE85_5395 [Porphyridium purpureum]|uniref:Uncharacterized protein n=1 Tax=Porphyridium purpureum TaxID=35688 RepID=A0A5J4Z3E5_PORPP|nr:hypothetical protein FVE85_5395 [Porphyridium purpureum]|eukprot:POR3654..scf295_1